VPHAPEIPVSPHPVTGTPFPTPQQGREARFSTSIDSKHWWAGRPEQLQAFIEYKNCSLSLGLTKTTRVKQGYNFYGKKRPHKYEQLYKPLYYNLFSRTELETFLRTMRYMGAFAGGFAEAPHHPLYDMSMGQIDELCRSEITVEYYDEQGKFQVGPGWEILEVHCVNGNAKKVGARQAARLLARDPEARRKAWEQRIKSNPPIKRTIFKIRRVVKEDPYARVNGPNTFRVTAEAAPRLLERLLGLVDAVWKYKNRHQDQYEKRQHVERWQLQRSPLLDELVGPKLRHILTAAREDALFTDAWVYEDVDQGVLPHRLELYRQGKLRWDPSWEISEFMAQDLLFELEKQAKLEKLEAAKLLALIAILVSVLKKAPTWAKAVRHDLPEAAKLIGRKPATCRSRGPPH